MAEHYLAAAEVVQRCRVARESVLAAQQLPNLPLEAQQSMRGDLMGTAHGRILLKLESNADPLEWAQQCVKERMDAEELARAVQRRLAEYN